MPAVGPHGNIVKDCFSWSKHIFVMLYWPEPSRWNLVAQRHQHHKVDNGGWYVEWDKKWLLSAGLHKRRMNMCNENCAYRGWGDKDVQRYSAQLLQDWNPFLAIFDPIPCLFNHWVRKIGFKVGQSSFIYKVWLWTHLAWQGLLRPHSRARVFPL